MPGVGGVSTAWSGAVAAASADDARRATSAASAAAAAAAGTSQSGRGRLRLRRCAGRAAPCARRAVRQAAAGGRRWPAHSRLRPILSRRPLPVVRKTRASGNSTGCARRRRCTFAARAFLSLLQLGWAPAVGH